MKVLLRLYPKPWRERYGDEFSELLAASDVGWKTAADVARGAVDAHRRTGGWRMRRVAPWLLLVLVDLVIGWLNYHATDDVQVVAAALIVAGFGFVLWRPRWALFLIPALWLAIPASSIVAYATNYHPGVPKPAPPYETLIALIPAALGAAAALGARWALRQPKA